MRVVLDTGILIAALITKDTPPDRIYQARSARPALSRHVGSLRFFRKVNLQVCACERVWCKKSNEPYDIVIDNITDNLFTLCRTRYNLSISL